MTITEHATERAFAAERPCSLYAYHAPHVVRTDGHHVHAVYLQNRVYGRIQDPELKWLCPNCHTAVHAWLAWLLREARQPDPEPGWKVKQEAERTLAWYRAAQAEATA